MNLFNVERNELFNEDQPLTAGAVDPFTAVIAGVIILGIVCKEVSVVRE